MTKLESLEVVGKGRPWSFDGDGALFRLVSEAHRIRLAHHFDPVFPTCRAVAPKVRSGSTGHAAPAASPVSLADDPRDRED
jgi:hypothetical protein